MIRRLALRFIDTYQEQVRDRLGTCCPREPTCSEYGRQAFEEHAPLRAAYLTVRRIRSCRPSVGVAPGDIRTWP